jgi:membrane protein
MVLLGGHLMDWVGTGLQLQPLVVAIGKAVQWPTAIVFVALSCSLIYRYGPDLKEHRGWHWFTPGAAFGAFIWLVASFGFRIYLHFFDTYSVSYGSLGALMILLVWLYATALACLVGAEINAEIERSPRNDKGTSEVTN